MFFFSLAEIEKCEGDDLKKDGDMKKYLDIISNKNIKLSERVLIPVQQYPKVSAATRPASWSIRWLESRHVTPLLLFLLTQM